jgi:glycosyltransferase involved in cell wall biosynthesis
MDLSIIICTYNGADRIFNALEGIAGLQIPESILSLELIIVDNGSTDLTRETVTDFLKKNQLAFNCRLLSEQKKGLLYARMKGIHESKFSWILFCDDDNLLFPDYLIRACEVISLSPSIGALGGQGIPMILGEKPEWFESRSYSYAVGPQSSKNGKMTSGSHLYGAGVLLKKSYLEFYFNQGVYPVLCGREGIKQTAGDDLELSYLISLAGGEIWYEEKMKFHHVIPSHRLTEDFYQKMVLGHAAAEGLLYFYQSILQNRRISTFSFVFKLTGRLLESGLLMTKYRFRSFFSKQSRFSFQLNHAKFFSYFDNANLILNQFKKVKAVLKK